jgi:hypothetical protein
LQDLLVLGVSGPRRDDQQQGRNKQFHSHFETSF